MPYTIGHRRITLDSTQLSESDKQLILQHRKVFRYCLNDAAYRYFINLKKIIHLYGDIITIYSTLLRKVPNYDDITKMTNKCKLALLKLEEDFNDIFGVEINISFSRQWQDKSYESVQGLGSLLTRSTIEAFGYVVKNLNCIEIFFKHYSNLKKLLIPYLGEQTESIMRSLQKTAWLFDYVTIVDQLSTIDELTEPIMKQLKKIEKMTSGLEKETIILDRAFITFDPSLKQYTSILLGKAILKQEVDIRNCELIKRRDVCFQAAEHVVSIPLTEQQQTNPIKDFSAYLTYLAMFLVVLIGFIIYRLFKVLFG